MPEPTIRTGQVCVSLYTVGSVPVWHRAVIKRVTGNAIGVTLVDYGTYATVRREDLRFLHNDFFNFPVQSFLSKLYAIKQSDVGPWSITANKRFLELVSVTDAEFYLNSVEPEVSMFFNSFESTIFHYNTFIKLGKLVLYLYIPNKEFNSSL